MSKNSVISKPANCANCHHTLSDEDKYCPICGQKALPEHLTFKYFIHEFLNNYFSFDSKFFNTVKYLILKPSFLSSEFIKGRRVGYINPIQLFVFSSFLYFLVNSFMFLKEQQNDSYLVNFTNGDQNILIDSIDIEQADTLYIVKEGEKSDTINNSYLGEFLKKGQDFNSLDRESQNEKVSRVISYSVFLLMPIFALYLGWFFKKKKKHYLENIIFSLHFHAFYFIAGVLLLLFDKVLTGDIDTLILYLLVFVYLIVSLRKFYKFSWLSTCFRFLGLILVYSITVSIILVCSILISIVI